MNKKTKKRVKWGLIALAAICAVAVAFWLVYQKLEEKKLKDLSITFIQELKNATCVPEEFSENPEDMDEEDIERLKEHVTEILSAYMVVGTDQFLFQNDYYQRSVDTNTNARYRKADIDYRETISIDIYQDTAEVDLLVGVNFWKKFREEKIYVQELQVSYVKMKGDWKISAFSLNPWDVVYE